jgi:hypothetical protein
MVRATLAIQVLTLALAVALPSPGQEAPPEHWQSQGVLGADLSRATNTQLFLPSTPQNTSEYSTIAGDLNLLLGGYLKDPRLLPFRVNFSEEHGSNSVALGSYRDNVCGFGFDASFLPDRPFPFHIFYQKSEYGATGASFGENSDASSFGFDWSLNVHRLPHLNVRYLKQSNELQLITSVTNTSYRLNEFSIDASDNWKGWKWNGGFADFSTTNNTAAGLNLASPFQESLKVQSLLVNRTFWDNKARFSFIDRLQWQQEQFLGQPGGQFTDDYATAQLRIDHTAKLSSNYLIDFSRVSSTSEALQTASEGTGSSVSLLQVPPINSETFGAGVQYRLTPDWTLFEQFQDYHATAIQTAGVLEAETSLADSLSGASFTKGWRGLDLEARYAGDLQVGGTNLGHHPTTFSNDVDGRVAWGNPRRLRLVASGIDSRDNLVDELGGFTTNRTARLQAENSRLRGWHVRGNVERTRVEFLSVSGDVKSDTTNYSAQIEGRRLSLSGGHQTSTGAGALFPAIVTAEQWLTIPLPLNELVATPLLNRLSHTDTAAATFRVLKQFDVSADYMNERDVLALSQPRFRTTDFSARYRVGKVSIQAGFGYYRIENITIPLRTGNAFNRYYLRVTRDFKIF